MIDLANLGGENPPPADQHVGLTTPAHVGASDNGSGKLPVGGPVTLPQPSDKERLACFCGVGLFDIAGLASIDYHGCTHGVSDLTITFIHNCPLKTPSCISLKFIIS